VDDDEVIPFETRRPKIVGRVGGRVDEFTARLRLFGDALDPEEITSVLGCRPSACERKGQLIGRGKRQVTAKRGAWRLESTRPRSADISDHLRDILMRVNGDPAVWMDLTTRFEVDVYCGAFIAEWNRGFELPADLLEALARRRLRIGFDIYANGAEG
jgi:hypothetical protein